MNSLKANFGCVNVRIAAYPEWRERHASALGVPVEIYSRAAVLVDRAPVAFIEGDTPEERAVVAARRPRDTHHFSFSHTFLRARVSSSGRAPRRDDPSEP